MTSVSLRYFNKLIPAKKNTAPRMMAGHCPAPNAKDPNADNTPKIRAIEPPTAIITAKILIMTFVY